MTADEVIQRLNLVPHPEGGYFVESFRAPASVSSDSHRGKRAASTAIYFLLRTGELSALHRVCSDEVWHHYAGDSVELHEIDAGGRHRRHGLGAALDGDERPQIVIAAGHWQAARPRRGAHGFALCGCTVAPGFEFSDFEMPQRSVLLGRFPHLAELIETFTRPDPS